MHKIVFTALLILSIASFAFSEKRDVTPYGDYCKDCSTYGKCKVVMSPKRSEKALDKYYKEKGYKVENVNHKGRFIEADVYKNKKHVDKVLFDRKTGRLRSVY